MSNEVLTGAVRWFDRAKGFGFIQMENGEDCHVHHSCINDPDQKGFKRLHAGEEVEYTRIQTEKGWSAGDVKRLESRPWFM